MLVEAVATESSAMSVAPAAEAVDGADAAPVAAPVAASVNGAASPDAEADTEEEETLPASPMSMQDGIKAVQHAFANAGQIRWPMYVRQARQFLRTAIQGFDERKYGFASVVDLLRAAGKEGVFRIERDRQGAVRVFPGAHLQPKAAPMDGLPVDIDETIDIEVPTELVADASVGFDQSTIEGDVDPVALPEPEMAAADLAEPSMDDDEVIEDDGPQPGNSIHEPPSHSRGRKTKAAAPARSRSTRAPRGGAAKTSRPRARKPKPS